MSLYSVTSWRGPTIRGAVSPCSRHTISSPDETAALPFRLPATAPAECGEEAMVSWILAHGSGLDELAIFIFPVIFGLGLWIITKKKPDEDEAEDDSA